MALYVDVAERIIKLIEQGTLKDGEKVPSIRSLSSDLKVSINTVKEAYLSLENKNYIYSKPQSGFYVRNLNNKLKTSESENMITLSPTQVSICRIYSSQLIDGKCPPEAELAVCLLDSKFWPMQKISSYYNEVVKYPNNEAFNYTLPPGNLLLREQIALQAIRGGMNISPDEIIITSGCTDSLTMALMTICNEGDTIAIESPCYFNVLQICEELKINVIEVPNNEESGLSIDTLKFVIDYHNIKAFFCIPNFNNPTGKVMSDTKKQELVNCLEESGVPLIEDDIYGEIYYENERPRTCKSFDKTGNVILCSSFSKVITPGLRVGWIVPGKFYKEVEKKKLLFSLGSNSASQLAVAHFLKEGGFERHNRKIRKILKEQITAMAQFIIANFPEGTKVNIPQGGIALWIACPKEIDTHELYNRIKEKGILFAPGIIFSTTGKYKNYFRLNGGTWNLRIKKALSAIADELKSMF